MVDEMSCDYTEGGTIRTHRRDIDEKNWQNCIQVAEREK